MAFAVLRTSFAPHPGPSSPLAGSERAQRQWDRFEQTYPDQAATAYALLSSPPAETGWMYRVRGSGPAARVIVGGIEHQRWGLRVGNDDFGGDILFFLSEATVVITSVTTWQNRMSL